ncbi:anti-sigma factor [Mucilaginibacter sp. RS28]|uniref:Regulator of SigK n=1 Tax=Mucilaginibacter straminoryzae TaxID=2932774 RepID=A0A9X1X5M4_9SPHI|nr:anti-sigma factor [Mucilaginibacter straminoryzae]MCJ8211388.1 anti-sigma factor [Mucilaginibacter straminoryzae]
MEDVKAYIESGILELYVLGDISAEEKLQVETMASKHPEVKAELDAIESSMERYAELNEVEPAPALRERVLNSLVTNLGDDRIFRDKPASAREEKVVQLVQQKSNNFYKYAFAACLALLVVSVAALVTIYNKYQSANGQLVTLQLQNQKFANTVNLLDGQLSVFRDPSFKMIRLNGTSKTPKSELMIGWSPNRKKLIIDMGRSRMPLTDETHSYQLWAIVGGKPVDLGVFEANEQNADALKEMKAVDSAEAFAVTLEPRGGSPIPTMDNMMVVGNTK